MDPAQVRAQLERILASASFAEAGRAKTFLRFIVSLALEGRASEIKEFLIAVEVLGRNSSFDSKSDPIVRVEARRLRDRLRSYYEDEGRSDPVLISLPKGGYVPEFLELRPPASASGTAVLRLSILPPENGCFESFAVSPDGRQLAFTAASNGRLMLWVRALDTLDPRPLIGTEGATWPFWSPDGRSIAFFTRSKLKRICIAGGPPEDIAAVVLGRGGSWNSDNVILFCPRPVGVLYRIAATGGTPQAVTLLDITRAEVVHAFPQFLPDGQHFLYFASSTRRGESSIRVGSLESAGGTVLVSGDTTAAYAPVLREHSGALLFVHDAALMAQPLDLQRLRLRDQPAIVVERVRYRRWYQAAFSISNNGVLVYDGGGSGDRQFAWFDRGGNLVATVGPRNDYNSPFTSFSLSPNERFLVVQRHDDPDTVLPTIWVIDLEREGSAWRWTEPDAAEPAFNPIWSPDGSEILFSRGDDRQMRLLRRSLTGGSPTCVLDTPGPKFLTDWSRDGKSITFGSQWPEYRTMHTWVLPLEESETTQRAWPLLQHSYVECGARFSPGSPREAPSWIAYTSNETGRFEVYVRDYPKGERKWQISGHGGWNPCWRPDGQELFYLTPEGTLMAVPLGLAAAGIDPGHAQALFETGLRLNELNIWSTQYAVSRDGHHFLLNRRCVQAEPSTLTAVVPW
jgi:Tol biopolymer transport system component